VLTEVRAAAPAPRRAPRSIAWALLLGSAAAVLVTGLIATAVVLSRLAPGPVPARPLFWISFFIACLLTLASLGLRALRWVFLLRRSDTRIPIRDAYIGYLAGLSLLLAPLLLGEIAIRAYVLRERGQVSAPTTAVLNLWERLLDAVALAGIAVATALASGSVSAMTAGLLALVVASLIGPLRRFGLRALSSAVRYLARRTGTLDEFAVTRLASTRTWIVGLTTSVVAWLFPGLALWGLVTAWGVAYSLLQAESSYSHSTLIGGFVLAPGGILVAGGRLLADLDQAGIPAASAAWSILAIRLATAGLSTALGALVLLFHLSVRPAAASHFDEIADAYDVQIPEPRRSALLARKTDLMREILSAGAFGNHGLDVGCGQGWYVARMRHLGFDVVGIDASAGQVELAARNVGGGLVRVGSALQIPAADAAYDFAYSINVLHHLASVDEQRAAFTELFRVIRPGGLLFVHEINTTNVLFRFYMGYVFPSLNCIDEGVERWLRPDRLAGYTDVPVVDVRYFTFLPEFTPARIVRLLAPLERRLEQSALGVYSAHYMAVFRKPV
jgi:uncharacterized protein (TIRG00374 family)